ncbi:MAG: DNA-binding protein WhiA [Micrococcales bacterium]|jgi:DNA-binding protein WhiA|nr:DNA-binding protein WhiA [Microbacteriaceae bacterium]NBR22206.1 DNA-binding protein WhiA [Micrococcales bacterium]NBX94313.1 DNA-binding protein WhiA [Actinomycetota bacterium]NBR77566.1 DNA-binding protein WhiA [Microbacteriaceae bacterium]NBS60457.1 DNA-binding protein WhiA [Microbacteriaceae bacterium]
MALTAELKDELARVEVSKSNIKAAELSTILRFCGGLHLVGGKIVVEIEVDTTALARRVKKDLVDVYGCDSELAIISAGGIRKTAKYQIRVTANAEILARQTGLIDTKNRPVRGLPAALVSGSKAEAAAVWRGAILAHGSLTDPGRSATLEITAPGNEAAMALVGIARRLDVIAKVREARGVYRVVVREGDAIVEILKHIGAHGIVLKYEELRVRREVRGKQNRLANFDNANLMRSAQAAVASGMRVRRAMEILGDNIPEHLKMAGDLRLQHRDASLDDLGRLASPPLTKDAIAGRIRRLLALADKVAAEQGIPGTELDQD